MRKLKQAHRHDPANGIYGDCHRTCIAMILDMDRDDVPHFAAEAERDEDLFWRLQDDWLGKRGLTMASFGFAAALDAVLEQMGAQAPKVHYILGGKSMSGAHHSVVALGGHIAADPSPDGSGLVGPCADGHYWVDLLCPISHPRH